MSGMAVYNMNGEQVGDVVLKDELFMAPVREGAIYHTMVAQQSNLRTGTASTKKRGEVRGGGRKPWPQKGTGRSRHGSSRSPLWVGGAVTFGPTPERNYSRKVTKRVKRIALKSALSAKVRDNKLIVVDEISLSRPGTREIRKMLENVVNATGNSGDSPKTLLVLARPDENVTKSARNLPGVKTIPAHIINVLDILSYEYLVITRDGLKMAEEVFA